MILLGKKHSTESSRYIRGYLFGKELLNLKKSMKKVKSHVRHEKRSGINAWDVSNTPLDEYAGIPFETAPPEARLNFRKFLLEKAQTLNDGKTLKVLDIGGFTFSQWKDAPISNIEVQGTTLTPELVDPSMASAVKICCAYELHKIFPKNYFDIVVSHYANYDQERDALENAIYITKPGGEILFSGEENFYGLYQLGHFTKENPLHEKLFDILAYVDGRKYEGRWFYHLKKKNDAPLDELLQSAQKNSFLGKVRLFLGNMNFF